MRKSPFFALASASIFASFLGNGCASSDPPPDDSGGNSGDQSDAATGAADSGSVDQSDSSSFTDDSASPTPDSGSTSSHCGDACTKNPRAPCYQGAVFCPGDGSEQCQDSSFAPAGTACGNGNVCDGQGSCVTEAGTPVDSGTPADSGGGGMDSGGSCTPGGACGTNSGAPCKTGAVACNGGVASCVDNGNAAHGTSCGNGMVCDGNGACVATGNDGGVTCHVVVNEVQTGGSASASDEWVEIYNPCSGSQSLSGLKLVYRSATGTSDVSLVTLSGSMAAGAYLLYVGSAYTGSAAPDGTFGSGLAAAGGGVAIVDTNDKPIDSVGYGTAMNAFVEGIAAIAPSPGQSIGRSPNGHDTNNNSLDFKTYLTPSPKAANP